MTQETLGYVELEWTCKHCGGKNPGTEKKCLQCGAPMYQQAEFELPDQVELITDAEEIQKAATSRPDIHCPYCGTRNPGDATHCRQCGGELGKGKARKRGGVVGAAPIPAQPAAAPAAKPKKARKPRRPARRTKSRRRRTATAPAAEPRRAGILFPIIVVGILALIFVCVVGFIFLTSKTEDVRGTVQEVTWTRSIPVESLQPVSQEGWRDDIPPDARISACQPKFHHTQSEPVVEPGVKTEKVCGTPYTLDQGDGYGKVVRDCEYKVYADWCQYTRDEWQVLYTETATGHDLNPYWPQVRLQVGQREGKRSEKYEVVFETEEKSYRYRARDATEFAQFTGGSKWILAVNALGGVNSVESAQ